MIKTPSEQSNNAELSVWFLCGKVVGGGFGKKVMFDLKDPQIRHTIH